MPNEKRLPFASNFRKGEDGRDVLKNGFTVREGAGLYNTFRVGEIYVGRVTQGIAALSPGLVSFAPSAQFP